MQNDGEDVEQPIGVGLGIQRFYWPRNSVILGKTGALQIIWFVLIATFVMLLPKKNMLLPFSLILIKLMTPCGNSILSGLYNFDFRGYLPTFIDGFLSRQLFQVRAGSTLSDTYEQGMGVPQGSISSPVLFSLKINNIAQSVFKGSEASLFMDDFALCICAKPLLHAQRLMQLYVNSVQDWVSNNGFRFSTNKTVCLHFCNQHKHFAELSILWDENPIKAVTEAKFLGVIFDQTVSSNSHVNYLQTNCLRALDILKVVGLTEWGGRSENSTLPLANPCKI